MGKKTFPDRRSPTRDLDAAPGQVPIRAVCPSQRGAVTILDRLIYGFVWVVCGTLVVVRTYWRLYWQLAFLLCTAVAISGLPLMLLWYLELPEMLAGLVPLSVIVLAFRQSLPPRPWSKPWTTVLLEAPAGATERLLRWANVYVVCVLLIAPLALLMPTAILVLWFGFGIRWGW